MNERLLQVLSRHIGAANGVGVTALARELCGRSGFAQDERKIRHAIEALRAEGHHICAHPSTGYYIAETDVELDRTCEFLYRRAMTSLRQVAAMKRVSLPDLAGQLNIRLEDRQ